MSQRAVVATHQAICIKMLGEPKISKFELSIFQLAEVLDWFSKLATLISDKPLQTKVTIIQVKNNILAFDVTVHYTARVYKSKRINCVQRDSADNVFNKASHFIVF